MPLTPEQLAREKIDAQLVDCGWVIQRYRDYDPSGGQGIALIELPVKVGAADYLLLVDKQPVGVIEAKKEGTTLSGVADQSGHHGDQLPDFLAIKGPLPSLYESTGIRPRFASVNVEIVGKKSVAALGTQTLFRDCERLLWASELWRRLGTQTSTAQNLVTEYTHERAVADGVNVGYDVYRIRTEVTARGSRVLSPTDICLLAICRPSAGPIISITRFVNI